MSDKEKRETATRVILCWLLIVAAIVTVLIYDARDVEAKTRQNGLATVTHEGELRLSHYGYVKIKGKTYYAHHSTSAMYKKGEVARSTYRVRGGKLYYFDETGAMVKRNSAKYPYITFHRNGSVKYIYTTSIIRRTRYNADRRREQWLNDNGKWEDVGQQFWPYGIIDWQW